MVHVLFKRDHVVIGRQRVDKPRHHRQVDHRGFIHHQHVKMQRVSGVVTQALAARLVETYSDRLLRLAYSILNSVPDAQDVCQEVLLKRLEYPGAFENEKHEQAWMVRVTVNACKNVRRSPWRTRTVGLDAVAEPAAFQPEEGGVLEEVQRLPAKYREVLVLYYYLGYDTNEIGEILGLRADAVRTRMSRARMKLKHVLEGLGYGRLSG